MLEQEGVDQPVREHAAKRLATVAPALGLLHAREAAQRSDDEYKAKPIVTLQRLRGWWSGRLPYLEARGIPTEWPRFMAGLAERASEVGNETADVTRHLEVMRPPKEAARREARSGGGVRRASVGRCVMPKTPASSLTHSLTLLSLTHITSRSQVVGPHRTVEAISRARIVDSEGGAHLERRQQQRRICRRALEAPRLLKR